MKISYQSPIILKEKNQLIQAKLQKSKSMKQLSILKKKSQNKQIKIKKDSRLNAIKLPLLEKQSQKNILTQKKSTQLIISKQNNNKQENSQQLKKYNSIKDNFNEQVQQINKDEQKKNEKQQNQKEYINNKLEVQFLTNNIDQFICNSNIIDKYLVKHTIGLGSQAIVRFGVDQNNKNNQVAIKIYHKYKLNDKLKKSYLENEIEIMKKINHQNIIKLIKVVENQQSFNIITEFIGLNTLHYHLKVLAIQNKKKNIKILEGEAKRIFKQIISALEYLHQNNIAHRDVKLDNILLDQNNNVKLIDFGFSLVTYPYQKVNSYCGSLNYMSPEILQKQEYLCFPADIWASGVLLYVILCGTFPFKGENEREVYDYIENGEIQYPDHLSQGVKDLFQKIFELDQINRISASQILRSDWLNPAEKNNIKDINYKYELLM